ncbi:MAG: S-layer homology domain-containing protein [Deltaproteobacteria bacterium]
MKSFRKALSLIVAFAMVLTLMIPVFAATPADVTGTAYEDAVGKLVTLGIIKGYEDGTFKPDQNITRAEFAKIACYIIGVQAAADLAKGKTKFSDVSADNWASGYINVAAEKGMIKGYPDKTFKPSANVTYAEAITILVRAVGMGDYVEKAGGTWPANYLEKAASAGITSDVTGFSGSTAALRGVIAQLSWNALEAEKWGAKEYTASGITYGPIGKTLLEEQYKDYVFKNSDDKYVTKFFEDIKVIGTQAGGTMDADQIKLDLTGKTALKDMLGTSNNDAIVDVTATGINLAGLFGLKVDLLFGKDNKVANIKVATPASDIASGIVDDYLVADQKIQIKASKDATATKKYGFVASPVVIVNTQPIANLNTFFTTVVPELENSTVSASMILDGGSIETLKLTTADVVTVPGIASMEQFVVKEINSRNEVKNVSDNSATMFDLDDLSDSNDYIIIKNGKPAAKSDIKAGDAVTYVERTGMTYIMVSDVKVTGKVTKISGDTAAAGSETRKKLTINGKVYTMPYDGAAVMTKNGSTEDENIKAIDSMGDFYNKDASVTLNVLGEILLINGSVKSSANLQTGVVVKDMTVNGADYNFKVLGPDGVAKNYIVTGDKYAVIAGSVLVRSDANEVAFDNTLISKGAIVVYDVSSDGKIDADNLYVITGRTINDNDEDLYVNYVTAPTTITVKDASKKITVGANTYYANSATTYLNKNAANIEKLSGWNNVVSDDYTGVGDDANSILDDANFYIVADSNNIIKSIILDSLSADYLGSDYSYGIYVDQDNDADDSYVTLNINGSEVRYKVASSVYADIEKGDLVRFKLNGDGEYATTTSDSLRANVSAIEDLAEAGSGLANKIDKINKTDRIITFKAAGDRYGENADVLANLTTVKLAADVLVYDSRSGEIKLAKLDDISSAMYVVVDNYDAENDEFGIVIICD